MPHVSWFSLDVEAPTPVVISHLPTHKHSPTSSSSSSLSLANKRSCAVSKYIADRWEKLSRTERQPASSGPVLFTPGRQSVDPTRPPWARQYRIRRGVDDPFSKPLPKCKEPPVMLTPPPRTCSRQVVTSRFSHSVEAEVSERSGSYSTLVSRTSAFPQKLANPDLPIPHPSPSEWVRADTLSWISVYA